MTDIPLGNLIVRLLGDSSKFEKMLARAQAKMEGATKKMRAEGKRLTAAVTAPIVALGALSVNEFSKFDAAMTKSTAIMGKMTDEVRAGMEEQARAISRDTITSAEQLAESYFFLASAGQNAAQSMASLPAVEKFAVAGAFDMAKATDLLTDAQSALGLTSKDTQENLQNMVDLSDVLVKANTLANASVEQFSKALVTKSGAALRLLNKDMNEGVAVLAAFADQGVKGELAGEKLAIVLRDLQNSAVKNEKAWQDMGMQVFDAAGNMLPIADIIAQLEKRFEGLTDKEKKQTAQLLKFQDRSFSALQMLIGTSDKIKEYNKQLEEAGGITKEVADKQLQSFASQLKILQNQLKDVAIEIGGDLVPIVKELTRWIKGMIEWWRGLSDETKKWILIATGVLALVGPLLIGLGLLASALSFITLKGLLLSAVFLASALAVGILTDGIMQFFNAGNLGIVDMVNNFRIGGFSIRAQLEGMWLEIMAGSDRAVNTIITNWELVKFAFFEIGGSIWRYFIRVGQGITGALINALDTVTGGAISTKLAKSMTSANKFFQASIDDSMTAVGERSTELNQKMGRLSRSHEENQRSIQQTIEKTFLEDIAKGEGKTKSKGINLPKSLTSILEQAQKAIDLGTAGAQVSAPTGARSTQEFQTLSARRFAFTGPSVSRKKEQDVKAKGVEDRLDELIDIQKNNNKVVLG